MKNQTRLNLLKQKNNNYDLLRRCGYKHGILGVLKWKGSRFLEKAHAEGGFVFYFFISRSIKNKTKEPKFSQPHRFHLLNLNFLVKVTSGRFFLSLLWRQMDESTQWEE